MEFSWPFHGALLQSRVGLAHSQGSRGGTHPLPNLDVAFQVGAAQLEAGEVFHRGHLFGGGHDTAPRKPAPISLKLESVPTLSRISWPKSLPQTAMEVVIAAVDVGHNVNIRQGREGSQGTDGLAE